MLKTSSAEFREEEQRLFVIFSFFKDKLSSLSKTATEKQGTLKWVLCLLSRFWVLAVTLRPMTTAALVSLIVATDRPRRISSLSLDRIMTPPVIQQEWKTFNHDSKLAFLAFPQSWTYTRLIRLRGYLLAEWLEAGFSDCESPIIDGSDPSTYQDILCLNDLIGNDLLKDFLCWWHAPPGAVQEEFHRPFQSKCFYPTTVSGDNVKTMALEDNTVSSNFLSPEGCHDGCIKNVHYQRQWVLPAFSNP